MTPGASRIFNDRGGPEYDGSRSWLPAGLPWPIGVGGVVALVTAYRRQRVAGFAQDLVAQTEQRIRALARAARAARPRPAHPGVTQRARGILGLVSTRGTLPATKRTRQSYRRASTAVPAAGLLRLRWRGPRYQPGEYLRQVAR